MNMHALELAQFGFAYPGGAPIFEEVTWQVEAGSFTLLVGETGCGKTTLLRCIKPEISPVGTRRGTMRVFGEVPAKTNGYEATLAVGYVAQNPSNQLVCDTVWHELAFGLENLGLEQVEMSRRVAEVAHFFGIEPWMHTKTAELSGGQAQMVNLAAALAMHPRLLLLDEPTAQLDPVASKNFAHALFRLNRELGMTIIVATHEPEIMAEYATECVALEGGTLASRDLREFASNVQEWPQVSAAARECLARWAACEDEAELIADGYTQVGNCVRTGCGVVDGGGASGGSTVAGGGTIAGSGTSGGSTSGGAVALALKDVFMRYRSDDAWVLAGLDVDFEQGHIHALVGGNGCGKSTLLRVAAGVMKIERGRIECPLRASQVLLPQNPKTLFVCDSVAEELAEWQASCGYTQLDTDDLLAEFKLLDKKEQHPYDLSGGQQQLLALAKLLLTRPQLLLLDEPSKGLDAQMKALVALKLRAFAGAGATIVMSTHDLPFAALVADSVAMMFDGACACHELTAQFFEGNLFYKPAPDGFSRFLAAQARPDAGDISAYDKSNGEKSNNSSENSSSPDGENNENDSSEKSERLL